jgi:metal-responsive CopG/Arc/MetJ family transcriptional regulator
MTGKYISVSLPKPFLKIIDSIIENKKVKYEDRSRLIEDAVKRHLKRYNFDLGEE